MTFFKRDSVLTQTSKATFLTLTSAIVRFSQSHTLEVEIFN